MYIFKTEGAGLQSRMNANLVKNVSPCAEHSSLVLTVWMKKTLRVVLTTEVVFLWDIDMFFIHHSSKSSL